MKKNRYAWLFVALLAAGISTWTAADFFARPVHAQAGFSAAALKGSYGFTEHGDVNTTTPLVGMGVLMADGNGGISGTETVQVFGSGTQVRVFQGSYTVNPDGTGTMVLNFAAPVTGDVNPDDNPPDPQTAKYDFLVVNNKAELRGIRAENGTLVSAEFARQ